MPYFSPLQITPNLTSPDLTRPRQSAPHPALLPLFTHAAPPQPRPHHSLPHHTVPSPTFSQPFCPHQSLPILSSPSPSEPRRAMLSPIVHSCPTKPLLPYPRLTVPNPAFLPTFYPRLSAPILTLAFLCIPARTTPRFSPRVSLAQPGQTTPIQFSAFLATPYILPSFSRQS